MDTISPKIVRTITWLAGIGAAFVALILPIGYFTLSYQLQIGALDAEAEINGRLASQVISANPEMWRFQQLKMEEFLRRRPRHGHREVRRVLDNENRVIAESVDPLHRPIVTRSVQLWDSGVKVGRIEISRSLQPLLLQTAGMALLGLVLGLGLFVVMRAVPLRALQRALENNARFVEEIKVSKEKLEKTNSRLTAQTAELTRSNEEVQQRYRETQTLHEISETILNSLELNLMMAGILDKAFEIGGFDIGVIRVLDYTREALEAVASRGYREPENVQRHRRKLEGFTTGAGTTRVMEDKAVHVVDLTQTQGNRTFKSEGVHTLVAVPLRSHEDVLGVVQLGSRMQREFRESELRILDAIGRQAGIAVQKARLYEETKRAQAALAEKAEELARSNTELQHFAYIASHDLQEPLRMVASYVQLLARRYNGKLDEEANEFINFAVDGAKRMQGLINALLAYSRIGTKGKPFEPTDCEEVLRTTLKNLQLAIEDSKAVVTHDPLPTVMADAAQVGQLFQNLIGNAIKFRDSRSPEVHIWAQRIGAEWLFSFRDNGIGIDPQYKERIFVIFQRLYNKQEYPGTGIGLALCKKIVERHGGRIWVESEPGNGSIFRFTIAA